MTREDHKRCYEAHRNLANTLLLDILVEGDEESADLADTIRHGLKIQEYHDELTAASAHLALAMLLEVVE